MCAHPTPRVALWSVSPRKIDKNGRSVFPEKWLVFPEKFLPLLFLSLFCSFAAIMHLPDLIWGSRSTNSARPSRKNWFRGSWIAQARLQYPFSKNRRLQFPKTRTVLKHKENTKETVRATLNPTRMSAANTKKTNGNPAGFRREWYFFGQEMGRLHHLRAGYTWFSVAFACLSILHPNNTMAERSVIPP